MPDFGYPLPDGWRPLGLEEAIAPDDIWLLRGPFNGELIVGDNYCITFESEYGKTMDQVWDGMSVPKDHVPGEWALRALPGRGFPKPKLPSNLIFARPLPLP